MDTKGEAQAAHTEGESTEAKGLAIVVRRRSDWTVRFCTSISPLDPPSVRSTTATLLLAPSSWASQSQIVAEGQPARGDRPSGSCIRM